MAGTGGGDPWRITGEDRAKHDSQFFQLKPVNGFVTGEQARGFFMQSGLPTAVLGQIWTLADMNSDGKMDKKEFSIAMHLIKKKLQGYELPKVLPAGLKADPSPVMGSFGTMPTPNMGMPVGSGGGMSMGMPMIGTMAPTSMVGSSMTMPIMANGVMGQGAYMGGPMMGAQKVMDNKPRAGSFGTLPQPSSQSFAMPHPSKLKYTQMFNTNDRHKRGHLTGVEARALLVQSGLPQPILAQIWTLSDIDKDGKLTCDEFCIAMHLADIAKSGRPLPQKLPPELLSEFKGRSDSFGSTPPQGHPPAGAPQQKDAFGDLLGGMGMPLQPQAPVQTEEEKMEEMKQQVTFEDRRKENFDKGQAELDRRRQLLQEQLQQENRARMEKERQEQEKRERIRQEQERKRLQELERQLEKQRQIEREKEEQRQKMLAQREAARQEIERHRQMDWERQRKEQLLSEKGREYEQLGAIKSQTSNLKCEYESLQGKKAEIAQKIEQVRNGVTEFTSSIEEMKTIRDTKLAGINKLQKELQDMNQKFTHQQHDREQLSLKVQTTIQSNPLSDTHRTVLHSVELKKTTIQRLKKDLEQIERETESQLIEIDNNNSEISKLNDRISELQNSMVAAQKSQSTQKQTEEEIKKKQEKERQEKIRKEFEAQRKKEELEQKQKEEKNNNKSVFQQQDSSSSASWFDFGSQNKTSAGSDDIWGSAFGSAAATDQTKQNDIWSSSGGDQSKSGDLWGSANQTSQETDKKDIWSSAFSSQPETSTQVIDTANKNKKQYKALFQFDARNTDELSLVPGDVIWVPEDQSGAEPGWIGGEKDGKFGWFPQAYAEEVQDQSSQFASDAFSGASSAVDAFSDKAVENLRSTESPFGSEVSPSPTPGQGQTAPDGLQAQALYPWKAKKDNHLTFNKGDVILVKEQQEMWWSGEINGKMGWFPKSYVKLISGPSSGSKTSSRSETPVGSIDKNDGIFSSHAEETSGEGEYYVAAYTYTSVEATDLTFNQGDVIQVTKMDGDWWTGTLAGRSGMFPANYVKKMEGQKPVGSVTATTVTTEVTTPPPVPVANTLTTAVAEVDSTVNLHGDGLNELSLLSKGTESSLSLTNSDTLGPNSVNADLFSKFDFTNSNMMKSEETQVDFYIGDENSSSSQIHSQSMTLESTNTDLDSVKVCGQPGPEKNQSTTGPMDFDFDPFNFSTYGNMEQIEIVDPFSELSPTISGNVGIGSDPFSSFSNPASSNTENITELSKSDTSPFIPLSSTPADEIENGIKLSNFGSDLPPPSASQTENLKVKNEAKDSTTDPFSTLSFGDSSHQDKSSNKMDTFSTDALGTPPPFPESNISESKKQDPSDPFGQFSGELTTSFGDQTDSVKKDTDPFSSLLSGQSDQKATEGQIAEADCDMFSSLPEKAENKTKADFQVLNNSLNTAIGENSTTNQVDTDPFNSLSVSGFEQVGKTESENKTKASSTGPESQKDNTGNAMFDMFSSFNASQQVEEPSGQNKETTAGTTGFGMFDSLNTSQQTAQSSEQNQNNSYPADMFGIQTGQNLSSGFDSQNLDNSAKIGDSPSIGQQYDDVYEDVDNRQDDIYEDVDNRQDIYEEVEYKSDIKPEMSNDTENPEVSQKSTLKKPEIATVIAPYTATGPEQLSLSPGQLIQVRKKSPSGWWEGELQARGQKKKIGWFPANYVKLLGSSSRRSTPDTSLQSHSQSSSPANTLNRTATPTMPPPQLGAQAQLDSKYVDRVMALYPYIAQNDDELTFHKDTVINVINKDDPNWWHGEQNGHMGVFPSNYVGPLTMSPPQENTWSTDPAVLAQTSAKESKRQNHIHELINTEETYMSDMSIVLEAFYTPMAEAKVMTEEELNSVFVNWKELIQCNRKLLKALRVRKTMCGEGQVIQVIGDILCENIPHMTPYIRFCSCQLSAAALIQHKTETSPEFKEVQKICVQNTKTKGMPLSSFLLKPMQRITKYPLMIEKIIQYTPEDHPDNQNLSDALSKAEELCSQVNEGVRERENSNRLEWIQCHVQCDGLSEKITFNSVTNCLGPRKLLFSGTLYKLKSNKELVGMLFNDFLLFTTPLSNSTSVFVFDPKAKTQYRMYKTPIFLNEVAVKKPSDEDSDPCQFHISHIDRVFNLKATNQTERDNWVKHIEAASRHYLDTERKKREKAHSSELKCVSVGRLLVVICEGVNLMSTNNDVRRTGGVGRLLVVIVEGTDLIASDENGKSDPYCEVSMGAQEHKTKVINATLNPKWNSSMQFTIRDLEQDVLCITVFDRDIFTPNDFLGRTEVRVKEIYNETRNKRGPMQKRLLLHEVKTGEVLVKLDLQLYENS